MNLIFKLRARVIPLVVMVLMTTAGWWVYRVITSSVKMALTQELSSVLDADIQALEEWIEFQKKIISLWSSEPECRTYIQQLTEIAKQSNYDLQTLLRSQPLADLRTHLAPVCDAYGYIDFVVTDSFGRNIAALFDEPVGQLPPSEQSEFVSRALAGETLVCKPFLSKVALPDTRGKFRRGYPTMFSTTPVRDQTGRAIAAMSFRIRPEKDFTRILRMARVGKTGETYAFGADGMILSDSRFFDQLHAVGLLPDEDHNFTVARMQIRDPGGNMLEGFQPSVPRKDQPLTKMAISAISGQSGIDVEGYRDYRGVPVIGARAWLPQYGFGIATEIDGVLGS